MISKVIKELVELIISVLIIGSVSTVGIEKAYFWIRKECLTKVSKGLRPMKPFNDLLWK